MSAFRRLGDDAEFTACVLLARHDLRLPSRRARNMQEGDGRAKSHDFRRHYYRHYSARRHAGYLHYFGLRVEPP